MYRLYIEDFTPPIWAIDTGSGTEQIRFEEVIVRTIGFTKYNLSADNVLDPKCWIEFPDATLKIVGRVAILKCQS